MFIKFIFAISTYFITGYLIIKLINFKKGNVFENIALSFGLGSGFIAITMFFLSICGITFTIATIILPQLILLLGYVHKFQVGFAQFASINNRKIGFKWDFSILEVVLTSFILFELFYVLFDAGSSPFLAWDAWGSWGFKAKALFINRYFYYKDWIQSPNTPHMNYSIFFPLQEAYIYIFLNKIHESFARIFCAFYFIGLISLFYGYLRLEFSRVFSLAFCFFLSTTPILLSEASNGYADVPLSFYISLSVINLYYYLKYSDYSRLWLSCIFFGFSMWMKNEGTSFWIATIISLILVMAIEFRLFMKKTKTLLILVLIPWLIFSPWIIFRLMLNIKNEYLSPPINKIIALLSERLFLILKALISEIFRIGHWNISWIVFLFLILIILVKNKSFKKELFLLFVIFFQTLFFVFVYIFSPYTSAEMIQWCAESLHRPLLQFYTIALFFIAQGIRYIMTDCKIAKDEVNKTALL